jgi:hypothetical protein
MSIACCEPLVMRMLSGEIWNAPAESRWAIPKGARLGLYDVALKRGGDRDARRWASGSFRVEAFSVPLVDARLSGPAIRCR